MKAPTEGKAALEAAEDAYWLTAVRYEGLTSKEAVQDALHAAIRAYLGALSDTHRLVPANFVQDTHRKLAPPAPGMDKGKTMAKDTAPMTAEERASAFLHGLRYGWDDEEEAVIHLMLIQAMHEATAQARAEGFAAGMEEAAGIADEHVGRGYSSPSFACLSVVAAIRARAAEGAKAEPESATP